MAITCLFFEQQVIGREKMGRHIFAEQEFYARL